MLTWLKRNRSDLMALVGLVLGILGPVSGYWFYRATLSIASLSLYDIGSHPRLMNVSAVSDSPIKLVRKDGSTVMKNVYLARLYLWNSGNVLLERSAIRSQLEIKAPDVEILDPKIATVTHSEITKLTVVKTGTNTLGIDFELLQADDGCSLNVLYAADKPSTFVMTGTVLGVKSFLASDAVTTGDLVLKIAKAALKIVLIFGGLVGAIAFVGFIAGAIDDGLKKTNNRTLLTSRKVLKWVGQVAFAAAVATAIILIAKDQVMRDPANFVPKALMSDVSPISRSKSIE